ncbi:MAG TPA: MBL fold metallo-hydrolase [Bacteroidia bacterium]|jgi:metallo-beta-lactamase family protein|nr:MBL fold metallo-hydrolase [Bacteroidia bacterium]
MMNDFVNITFLGAAGTVTGSKYLIQTTSKSILVDCGLFQGLKELRLLNWNDLPVKAKTIDMVLLTHGHLDHCGYLPRLVAQGFSGTIRATAPTIEIAKIILRDSAKIQEEDAERANTEKFSKHHPAKPLYTLEDVEKTLPLFQVQAPDEWIELDEKIKCRFKYNGHIIGATFIELKIKNKTFVFSGDIGRQTDFLLHAPQHPETADILFIESTYGDRLHQANAEEQLATIINRNSLKQGTIIIPSFAVERSQTLIYLLWKLKKQGAIPNIPVYLDSPMGSNVLDVFTHHLSWHKLPRELCQEMCQGIIQIQTIQETYRLADSTTPKIVIAGSGMASGGRVLFYFARYLDNPDATILLAGYQAEGTRGRALLEGAKHVKLFGKYFAVRATIESIESLSSHADQHDLINWMSHLNKCPEEIFITHGEQSGAHGLKNKIKEHFDWNAAIPKLNQTVTIPV